MLFHFVVSIFILTLVTLYYSMQVYLIFINK